MVLSGLQVTVTGGAGFIGSHLVERLAPRNQVTVVDDLSVGTPSNLEGLAGVALVVADVTDPAAVEAAVAGADIVFHLATSCLRTSLADPRKSLEVNGTGTLNVLLAALHAGVESFIYVSSSEVYGNAERAPMDEDHPLRGRTPYAATKLAGEALALSFHRTYGLPVTVVRPFNAYGPRSHAGGEAGELIPRFVARCRAGRPLDVFGTGQQTRDYTWVGDTARGIELAAGSTTLRGEAVNIGRGREVSVLEVAELVQRTVGRRVGVRHHPARPGDVDRHVAAVERARCGLGFEATVDIEDGLERYVRWVERQPAGPEAAWDGAEVINWRPLPSAR